MIRNSIFPKAQTCLLVACCLLVFAGSKAQTFGNEWINFAQQYYKIPVAQRGIHRLTYQDLQRAGLPLATIDPRRMQVFHRGVEQAVFIAGEGDAFFNETDYVEFYGEGNDGTLDARLYRPATAQPHPHYNNYSDTTYFFLTWRLDNAPGKRMAVVTESNTANLPPEPYHLAEKLLVLTNEYDDGRQFPESQTSRDEGQHAYYSEGEGWTGVRKNRFESVDYALPELSFLSNTNFKPQLEVLLAGRNNYPHNIEVFAGASASALRSLGLAAFNYHTNQRLRAALEPSDLASQNLTVRMRVNGVAGATADAASVSLIRLTYPQAWDMGGKPQKVFSFEPTAGNQRYVEIANPGAGTGLYDITDKNSPRRVTANVTNGKLAATVSNAKMLFAQAGFVPAPGTILKTNFRNLSPAANYLIVTHSELRKPVGGVNDAVRAYAEYRASAAGGGFDTLSVNVDLLYNQFSYGEYTPLAIHRFVQWMHKNGKPEYLLIIGRGALPDMVRKIPDRSMTFLGTNVKAFDFVPPPGKPGSDFVYSSGLAGQPNVPALATGRLSAINAQQVLNYLTKLKEHEALPPDLPWRKNLLHLSGGRTASEIPRFRSWVDGFKEVAEGKFLGGKVETRSKQNSESVELINIAQQTNDRGVGLVTFFGHSGRTVNDIDPGYVTDDTQGYRNKGKYPFVFVNGCQSGDVFNNQYTHAEDWVLGNPERGAIGWIAHSAFGYDGILKAYADLFYGTAFADSLFFGKSIGKVQQETIRRFVARVGNDDLLLTHSEQIILQGDPAVSMVPFAKPDYAINAASLFLKSFDDNEVSAAADSFRVAIVVSNYGKILNRKFAITVRRSLGDGSSQQLDTVLYNPVFYRDTLYFTVRNRGVAAGGNQTFEVFVDANGDIDEMNENNNTASRDFLIPAVGAVPLFPREYSIVGSQPVRFVAQSTITPLESRPYRIELDTVATFSSPARRETTVTGNFLINWETDLVRNAPDSTVYYWRVSLADQPIGERNSYTESSFIYISKSPEGWSQSRFPQFSKAALSTIVRNTATEKFEFTGNSIFLNVQTYGSGNQPEAYKQVELLLNNGPIVVGGRCNPGDPNTLVAVAFRRTTAQPYLVLPSLNCGKDLFPAHYLTNSYVAGGGLSAFLNGVQPNDFVLLFTTGSTDFSNWSPAMRQLLVGLGADATKLAQLKTGDPYVLLGQKGASPGKATEIYPVYDGAVPPLRQALRLQDTLRGSNDRGFVTSSIIGPASLWGTLYNAVRSLESPTLDKWQLDILGVNLQGNESVVFSDVKASPLSIDFINPAQYPYLKLRLQAKDSANLTPPQLKKWQVIYDGVPEGLINTSLVAADAYKIADQTEGGEIRIPVVFQNISPRAFQDSLTVEYSVLNLDNRQVKKYSFKVRKLAANGDTVRFTIAVKTDGLGGNNQLQVFVNPRILPEQSYANNVLNIPFKVNSDKINPILEVTFDGQRIMDGEIVSPSPMVVVRLKDENKVLIKKDTAGMELYLKRPDETTFEKINLGSVRWVPAGPDNNFRLEWQPQNLPDGVYTLRVQGADVAGNRAGAQPYQITFEVINASTITHFYPYPNPFSTSTRFVFTLTGATVPDQIKIQIMTVSGKVVREITHDELGPLRIGNNISSYAWDGSDEFGDKLANGVYLYRVITRINGQDMDRRATAADRAFKKEFGKMYILR